VVRTYYVYIFKIVFGGIKLLISLLGLCRISTSNRCLSFHLSPKSKHIFIRAGNTHLGGEDFDQRLMEYCMSQFKRKSGIDIVNDKRAVQRLRKQCENAKRTLSTQTSTVIDCEALANGEDFSLTLSRAKFEELNLDLFKKTLTPVTQVLKDSGMSKTNVDQVILVGGSTRIPKVQTLLSEFFGGKKLNKSINPDEAVVRTHH
jgi:molecular chaperone DnaK (HSP70)